MASSELNILGFVRIQEIFNAVQDIRQIPGRFVWKNRLTRQSATDADIIARFLGQAHVADIVADDQKAVTYEAARIKFEETMIPNLKIGRLLTQADIKRLEFLARANVGGNVDSSSAEAYFTQEAEDLNLGLDMRAETMIVGMMMDSFTYNRNGIIVNINWGMPAELKLVSTYPWTDNVNATPVADILNQRLIASTKYGKLYNRVTMSTPALRLMTKTNEFQSQVRNVYLNLSQPLPTIPYQNVDMLKGLAGTILGMVIELYDARIPTQPVDGSAPTYSPVMPLGQVILSDSADDNDTSKADWASGVVTESQVGSMGTNNAFGRFGPTTGPFSYVTVTPDLNPPTITYWAVERGIPRKKDIALSSTINAGTISDFISAGIAF